MAKIVPADIASSEYLNAHEPEIETLKRLRAELPDDYTIFHGLHWSNERQHFTTYGEIDFVIVNRSGDFLIIEQKNGSLDETGQGLIKNYGRNSKNVGGQVHRNIDNIREKFQKANGRDIRLTIDYLIYIPDHIVRNVNAASMEMSRIVDRNADQDLGQRIEEILGAGVTKHDGVEGRVFDFFNQTLGLVPAISGYVAAQKRVFTRMVAGLTDIVSKIEMSPFRLRVVGSAGTGKSQLTLAYSARALAHGKRPLLLCFNRPLCDSMRAITDPRVAVNTYYGFCNDTAALAGIAVDFGRMNEPGFWRGVQDQIMGATIPDDARYDCLVVDEGQDFKQEWFEILRLFLEDDASILWLEDPLQNLRDTDSVELPGFVTYRESANFRTPKSIGDFIRKTLGIEFVQRNTLPGLRVRVHSYSEPNDQLNIVNHRIKELVRAGFSHDEIAVVSCRGITSTAFADTDRFGTLPIRRFTGKYRPDGAQIYTDGIVFFDTIYRFKGHQAPAVLLVDIDEKIDESNWANRVLYCGMTRATVRLEMLVKDSNPRLPLFQKYQERPGAQLEAQNR